MIESKTLKQRVKLAATTHDDKPTAPQKAHSWLRLHTAGFDSNDTQLCHWEYYRFTLNLVTNVWNEVIS